MISPCHYCCLAHFRIVLAKIPQRYHLFPKIRYLSLGFVTLLRVILFPLQVEGADAAQHFDSEDGPIGNFAYVGAHSGNVEQEEQEHHAAAEPDNETVDLFQGYGHHAVEEVLIHELPHVETGEVELREGELAAVSRDVVIQEVRE